MNHDSPLEFRAFLYAALDRYTPDLVITLERKGTALLRAAMSGEPTEKRRLSWNCVRSSDALELLPPNALDERSILLLDDGMYAGSRIAQVRQYLIEKRHVNPTNIKVAAFSVHERATQPADLHFFAELTEARYREVRERMVREFQRLGALLLDTEHIAVTVHLNCGRLQFFDALARCGIAVEHLSMGGRSNLTIHNPLLLQEREFLATLPPGSSIRGVVRKIRVVENPDRSFSIVPIFYAATPAVFAANDLAGLDPSLARLGSNAAATFHLTGLHGALELLRTAFASLRELIRDGRVTVRIPRPSEEDESLSHLLALFPGLDTTALHVLVERAVESGRSWRRRSLYVPKRIDATAGTAASENLAALRWKILWNLRRGGDRAPHSTEPSRAPEGLTFADLTDQADLSNSAMGRQARRKTSTGRDTSGPPQLALFSAALDELIDDAKVITDVGTLRFSDNLPRLTRTFRLDGEVVLSDVRKATALWRLESPPPSAI